MLFNSLLFLFLFLPAVLGLYALSPKVGRNGLLLLASLIFYAWGGVGYLIILISSILVNHFLAVCINRATAMHAGKWLGLGIFINVGTLATFKYLDFAVQNLNSISELIGLEPAIKEPGLLLPLGISFFTFQQMSMLWDLYRSPTPQKVRLMDTALYVSLFPQLVAGPIVRYGQIIEQIKNRIPSIKLVRSGIHRFVIGLFRKVVIANNCAIIADEIFALHPSHYNPALAWFGITVFAVQVYHDFAGYSDMAIGLCRVFGFRIPENFNFPYVSTSVQEIWRRWHISLSSWFKDYVYIPLGGNRVGVKRTYVNLFIVFLLTGFWHGATWNFVLWGLIHGVFLVIERLGLRNHLRRMPTFLSWSYTAFIWLVTLTFFRMRHFTETAAYLSSMFGCAYSGRLHPTDFLDPESATILFLGIISSTPFFLLLRKSVLREFSGGGPFIQWGIEVISIVLLITGFITSVMYINAGSFNPFVYFRF